MKAAILSDVHGNAVALDDVGRAVVTFPADHPARALWTSIVRTGRRS